MGFEGKKGTGKTAWANVPLLGTTHTCCSHTQAIDSLAATIGVTLYRHTVQVEQGECFLVCVDNRRKYPHRTKRQSSTHIFYSFLCLITQQPGSARQGRRAP